MYASAGDKNAPIWTSNKSWSSALRFTTPSHQKYHHPLRILSLHRAPFSMLELLAVDASLGQIVLISCDVLTVQDLERLLQRLDFFLSPRHPVVVADTRINARRLQLVVIRQRSVQLLLRALQVRLLKHQSLLLILLLRGLVLDVGHLCSLVDLRVGHELIVLLLSRGLGSLGIRLQP